MKAKKAMACTGTPQEEVVSGKWRGEMKRAKRSPVGKHYTVKENNAQCKYCDTILKSDSGTALL